MTKRVLYDSSKVGVSAYLDERVPKLDLVITGHLNTAFENPSKFDRETIDILLDLHFACKSYIDKFNL